MEAAWNKHDAPVMDQAFVKDCDLVNVFGEWISGHDKLVKIHTALFAGPLRDSYQRMSVEKVRFVRPDVPWSTCDTIIRIATARYSQGTRARWVRWCLPRSRESGGSLRRKTQSCDRCQKRLSRLESHLHPNCHWPNPS